MRTRYIPTDSATLVNNDLCAVYYHNASCIAIGYKGRSSKPAFYHRFGNVEAMMTFINKFVQMVERSAAAKLERKAQEKAAAANLKAADHFQIGDVIYNTWGWEQTNIEYYQVVDIKGKSIVVQEIAQQEDNRHDSLRMSAYVLPCKDRFVLEGDKRVEFTLRLKAYPDGKVLIVSPSAHSYFSFHPWDGVAKCRTWYA